MELYVATNNAHKLSELRPIFSPLILKTPKDAAVDFDFEENGATFLENSIGKAFALYSALRRPLIADDSGLCVDALDGEPGVRSARYGSPDGRTKLTADERNAFLLSLMRGIGERRCRFVCCMTLVLDENRFFVAQETLEGVLLEESRGSGGFGYDPVVYLPERGMTVAELGEAEKNRISHRGKAALRIKDLIVSL